MKIFLSHSTSFDFRNELYRSLKLSSIWKKHEIYLPHDGKMIDTREIIRDSDLVLVEVSYPSTGQGIELGWATCHGKPMIVFHKKGMIGSSSIKFIATQLMEYSSAEELISKLGEIL